MNGRGWEHLRQLQNITRNGYLNLHNQRRDADNSFMDELLVDLPLIAVGLSMYIQFDIQPFLPVQLPDVIQHGSFAPILAMVGLALAGTGGVRLLFAVFEAATWVVSRLLKGK